MKCKKCNSSSALIILRKKDLYCRECFLANVTHKFRSSIGKNKILGKADNVLICLSGKEGSTVLLDLINNALSLDNHKKLRITPIFLHLCENYETIKNVIEQCQKYNYDLYSPHISEYVQSKSHIPIVNSLPIVNNELIEEYNNMQNSMLPTVKDDFITNIKRTLYIRYAKLLNCKYIFTGETTTTLATKLLVNLAIGRGSQVQSNVGFLDSRDMEIKIIRPMKDISEEELKLYINSKNLKVNDKQTSKENEHTSLQTVISTFVSSLQENYPSTISTICKTADKIGLQDECDNERHNMCVICQSILKPDEKAISALDATSISKIVSLRKHTDSGIDVDMEKNVINSTIFPYIHNRLCYACSRNYAEIKQSKIPSYIIETQK